MGGKGEAMEKWMTSRHRREKKAAQRSLWGFYGTPEWLALRKRVLAEYGKACMCCGGKPRRVHVDHVLPRSRFPELALAFSNLQVLCKPCNYAKGRHRYTDYRRPE